MFKGITESTGTHAIVIDNDGFTFSVGIFWREFVRDFIKGYEERNIDPIPNLLAYVGWRAYLDSDIKNILIELPERYKSKFEQLILLR